MRAPQQHAGGFGLFVSWCFACVDETTARSDAPVRAAAAAIAVAVGFARGRSRETHRRGGGDLRFALDELGSHFRAAHPGVDLAVTSGSSGNFFAQIQNGAPFDVFLSADVDYPKRLIAAGLANRDSLFLYGVGRIVVWVPAGSPLDPAALGIRVLEAASVRHVAIANPRHAPYGRAAEAALRSLGVYDQISPKLVSAENVAQAFEFVVGAAEAGIVALSLALAPAARGRGRYWEIPETAYPKIEQGGVILARAPSGPAAQFRAFLLSAEARRILRQYGFSAPQ